MRVLSPIKRGGVYLVPPPSLSTSTGGVSFCTPDFTVIARSAASAIVDAPGIQFVGSGVVTPPNGLIAEIAPFSIEILTGGRQELNSVVNWEVSVMGTSAVVGKLNKEIAPYSFDAHGFTTSQGELDIEFGFVESLTSRSGGFSDITSPGVIFSGGATTTILATASVMAPPFVLASVGTIASLGGANILVPPFDTLWGIARIDIPSVGVVSSGVSVSTANNIAYAFNTRIEEITRYIGYDFDSVIMFNNKYYGVRSSAIHLLEGITDNGVSIGAVATTPDLDFSTLKLKRVKKIYVGSDADVDVTTFVDQTEIGTYRSSIGKQRVSLPRGPKGRYWAFQLKNVAGGPFKIDEVEVLPTVIRKKI